MSRAAAPVGARLRVLLLSPYFLPAEQGGGSVRAVHYLSQQLRRDVDFVIAARDRDLHGNSPFSEAEKDAARRATGLDLRYLQRGLAGALGLRRLLREGFDLVYLNSLMAPDLGLLALLWLLGRRKPALLIAPRGELMPGALAQRPLAKRVYLALLRTSGLLARARFHATTRDEADAIVAALGPRPVHIAPDLPPPMATAAAAVPPRAPGPLRVLFLSRIDPVKNLGFALDVLARSKIEIDFDIVGPVGSEAVWADCRQRMARLPPQVRAHYLGAVPHAEVAGLFASHDLLLLPTQGENHGYVVLEALSAGCPVLISDRTPWRGLQALGVGADLPLDDSAPFVRMLATQAALTDAERQAQRDRCRAYAQEFQSAGTAITATLAMLQAAAQPKARMSSTSAGQSGG